MYKTLIYNGVAYDNYEISDKGVIRNKTTKHEMKNIISDRGYCRVVLYIKGIRKCIRIHKAVAEAFIPNPDKLPVVNHIDENKLNCNVDNLEWTTQKGNVQAHLRRCNEETPYFNNRKFTYDEVKAIRESRMKGVDLAKKYHVSPSTISYIRNNVLYANGY